MEPRLKVGRVLTDKVYQATLGQLGSFMGVRPWPIENGYPWVRCVSHSGWLDDSDILSVSRGAASFTFTQGLHLW